MNTKQRNILIVGLALLLGVLVFQPIRNTYTQPATLVERISGNHSIRNSYGDNDRNGILMLVVAGAMIGGLFLYRDPPSA